MRYDFETIIDRRGTHCEKWDLMEERYGVSSQDGLAMWVADMEFTPPPEVIKALQGVLDHGVFGYPGDFREYHAAIASWMERRHGWRIEQEWICTVHGLVMGVHLLVQALCRPGDGVVVQPPVYPPFRNAVRNNGCQLLRNQLVEDSAGLYRMDLDALAEQIDSWNADWATGRVRMLLLCSPHNPGGRVWSRTELEQLADICFARDVLIVSDEIHHDLVYSGHDHTVLASLWPQCAQRVVTCTSATKTFNMAGTMTGNLIIADPQLRGSVQQQLFRCGLYDPNSFGPLAATAAYSHGEPWLEALLQQLQANRDRVDAFVAASLPGVRSTPLQATYLSWLDFSGTGLSLREVLDRVQNKARLALNHGPSFGQGGELRMRLNFACPPAMLEEALERLGKAFT